MIGSAVARGRSAVEPIYASIDARMRHRPAPAVRPPTPDSADVGVVVQGPIVGTASAPDDQRLTQRVLRSVRRALPDAQLVLSTWKGADLCGLDADTVVLNDDPGPTQLRGPSSHWTNNVNRQAVSTRAGLELIARPVAIKLRSDLELVDDRALRLFGGWPARSDRVRVLRERVLVPSFYSFQGSRVFDRFPYQVSDWFQLGLHQDLLDLWSAPHWETSFEWLLGDRTVSPEQWVWMSLLNRHGEGATFDRHDLWQHSALSVVNNTVVLEPEDLGLRFLKFEPALRHRVAVLTHGEWQRLYDRHCGNGGRGRPDAQALLRTVIDRLWISGLGTRLFGAPFDVRLAVAPEAPARTPNTTQVLGSGVTTP